MQKHIIKNTRLLKIDRLTFFVDDGRLIINTPDARFPYPLSGQQTHQLLNLLFDHRAEIVGVGVAEQRERERRNKERSALREPKTKLIQLPDGTKALGVEIADLEREYNGGTEDESYG